VTATALPAIVIVVFCAVVEVLAVAEYDTVPLPEPLAPLVMLNQLADSVAVQVQPAGAVTVADPVPPELAREMLVGDTV
jgi:hypothetical protein